jgi:hypothetical protein
VPAAAAETSQTAAISHRGAHDMMSVSRQRRMHAAQLSLSLDRKTQARAADAAHMGGGCTPLPPPDDHGGEAAAATRLVRAARTRSWLPLGIAKPGMRLDSRRRRRQRSQRGRIETSDQMARWACPRLLVQLSSDTAVRVGSSEAGVSSLLH